MDNNSPVEKYYCAYVKLIFCVIKDINIAYKNMWRNAYEIRANHDKTTALTALDMPK